MNDKDVEIYLESMESSIMNGEKCDISLNINWVKTFPKEPGNYVIFEDGNLVYVGETGNIQKRMGDLRNTMNHCLRRNLGDEKFQNADGFDKADSKHNFPPHIETMVNEFIKTHLKVTYLVTKLGRKEIEEWIIEKHGKPIYNKRGRRR